MSVVKKWFVFGGLGLLLAVSCGGWIFWTNGVSVQVARVQRGTIQEFVDERGKTYLHDIHRITMPFPGRIEEITLVEGQRVEKGEIVAQIVRSDLQIALNEAQAAVDRYVAAIQENQDHSVEQRARQQANELVDSMVKTVKAAHARLTSSEKRLEYATKFRKDMERLFQENAASENDFERAQVDEVDRQVGYAQDALIWQSAQSMLKATELLPKIIEDYIKRKEKTRLVLENQKAEAQARLDDMQTRLKRGTMKSPVNGVVLERKIRSEMFLPAGTELLTIGQLEKLQVEVDVLSQDVGKIRLGDHVEIYGPAVDNEAGDGVPGIVQRIDPAGFTKISSLGVEQQRVNVNVAFAGEELTRLIDDKNLGVDFRVRVRIITDQKSNALLIPRSALFRGSDGQWQVYVVRWNRASITTVQVGLMNDQHVEIMNGLKDDDIVVVAPESDLRDAARVKVAS